MRVIIYYSIHGSTKQYASWLGKDLKCSVLEMNKIKQGMLKKYDSLIVMSGTYAGKMPLIDFLKTHWNEVSNKELIALAVGAAPENNWWSKLSYLFIPKYIKEKIKYFKIYGRYNEQAPPIKKEYLEHVINYIKKK